MSDPHQTQRTSCIQALHQSPTQIVAALSGGGTFIFGDLLSIPGGSRTLIEASVPYSQESISNYIGRVPEQFCCARTARTLAMTAFYRARKIIRSETLRKQGYIDIESIFPQDIDVSHELEDFSESTIIRASSFIVPVDLGEFDVYQHVIGIGCTASLLTDRQKQGEHRVHVAVQTLHQTIHFSLRLKKGSRTRKEEERLVADLVLNAIETARQETEKYLAAQPPQTWDVDSSLPPALFEDSTKEYRLSEYIPLQLKRGEVVHGERVVASPLLVELFFGKLVAVLRTRDGIRHTVSREEFDSSEAPFKPGEEFAHAIFPGSFSPIHEGHLEMINIAEERLQGQIALEISIQNVDKPPVDYIDLLHRLDQIARMKPNQAVWLTQTPLFVEKVKLFQWTTFVVGADTIKRTADLRFYFENVHRLHEVLRTIAFFNCRFLVFARKLKSGVESLDTLSIPDMLRSLCDDVPASVFTMDISSSDLRREET